MGEAVVVFDNLVQPHSSGTIGLTQKITAICQSDDLPGLEEVGLRAEQSAEGLQRMFQLK